MTRWRRARVAAPRAQVVLAHLEADVLGRGAPQGADAHHDLVLEEGGHVGALPGHHHHLGQGEGRRHGNETAQAPGEGGDDCHRVRVTLHGQAHHLRGPQGGPPALGPPDTFQGRVGQGVHGRPGRRGAGAVGHGDGPHEPELGGGRRHNVPVAGQAEAHAGPDRHDVEAAVTAAGPEPRLAQGQGHQVVGDRAGDAQGLLRQAGQGDGGPAVEGGLAHHPAAPGGAAQRDPGAGRGREPPGPGHGLGDRVLEEGDDVGGGAGPQRDLDGGVRGQGQVRDHDRQAGDGQRGAHDALRLGPHLQGRLGASRGRDLLGRGREQPGGDQRGGQARDGGGGDADGLHDLGPREAAVAQQLQDNAPLGPGQVRPGVLREGGRATRRHGPIVPDRRGRGLPAPVFLLPGEEDGDVVADAGTDPRPRLRPSLFRGKIILSSQRRTGRFP